MAVANGASYSMKLVPLFRGRPGGVFSERHWAIGLMAFSPQIAPLAQFAAMDCSKLAGQAFDLGAASTKFFF